MSIIWFNKVSDTDPNKIVFLNSEQYVVKTERELIDLIQNSWLRYDKMRYDLPRWYPERFRGEDSLAEVVSKIFTSWGKITFEWNPYNPTMYISDLKEVIAEEITMNNKIQFRQLLRLWEIKKEIEETFKIYSLKLSIGENPIWEWDAKHRISFDYLLEGFLHCGGRNYDVNDENMCDSREIENIIRSDIEYETKILNDPWKKNQIEWVDALSLSINEYIKNLEKIRKYTKNEDFEDYNNALQDLISKDSLIDRIHCSWHSNRWYSWYLYHKDNDRQAQYRISNHMNGEIMRDKAEVIHDSALYVTKNKWRGV
jgi:hypothetical protein